MEATRSQKISSLVEQRRPKVEKIEQVEQNLQKLANALEGLENQRQTILQSLNDPSVTGQLQDIELTHLQSKLRESQAALARLKTRFARATLNIGVVGLARQGKSRLLQTISGLSSVEIPDGDGWHCTGVRSLICHNPQVESYAELTFYSEKEFLHEVIAPYYRDDGLRLGFPPTSLAYFENNPLPPLPNSLIGWAESKTRYERLKKLHKNLKSYRALFNSPSPYRISLSQTRDYVAQRDLHDHEIFNYIAVREAKLVCSFPFEDVGQVALLDMPGLGDTGIGDEARLLKALSEEVDAVLFVRSPKSSGDNWSQPDLQLYDLARQAITELPLEKWSFLVLNHNHNPRYGDNLHNCENFIKSVRSGETRLKTVREEIVDCSNPDEVRQKILDPLLTYLAENLDKLDREYATAWQENLTRLQSEIHAQLERARKILSKATASDGEMRHFDREFEQLWEQLTNGLENLLKELREQRQTPAVEFEEQITLVLAKCRENKGLPTPEQIEKRRNKVNALGTAYNMYLDDIRTRLTNRFVELDGVLRHATAGLKVRVSEVLAGPQGGKLVALTDAKGKLFLEQLLGYLNDDADLAQLYRAVKVLADFELSYRGFIQYRVREHLDCLTPDLTRTRVTSDDTPEDVAHYLSQMYEEALYNVEAAFKKWLTDPNKASFAIVEEFIDQILRAEGAPQAWRNFYRSVRAEVWPTAFQMWSSRSLLQKQWQQILEEAETLNQPANLLFL